LWKVFKNEMDLVKEKHEGREKVALTQKLFHGTRATPPDKIYRSETGFNINYSNEGLWGKAIYFAVNSSYSNMYASTTPNGEKQMFMATVIIGDYV
jgi:hypothetical protein